MTDALTPYPEYKASDVPWLGDIPTHWIVNPGLAAFRQNQKKNTGMVETTVLSLSYGRIVVKPLEKLHGLVPSSFETYQIINPGDVIIRPTDLQNDWNSLRVGFARDRGIITSAYLALKATGVLLPEYMYLVLNAYDLMKIFYGMGSGLRQNLDFADLKRMPIVTPPADEQSAIVRFLDHADRRIRRYIAAKRRLIALLNEQKQTIIHQAVTRGLDPDVRLKPSGVEWLGDIPEHWEVSRLKFEASHIVDCLHATPNYTDGAPYPAIRTADLESGKLRLDKVRRVTQLQYDLWVSRLVPKAGDVLYTREGERFGLAAVVPEGIELCISQRMMIFRIRPQQNSSYIMWQLNCRHVYAQAAGDVIGATSPHVNVATIRNYRIILPPVEEQRQIVTWVNHECRDSETAIESAQREISLLREYRTRLIADVVTGKLDVRAAVAGLPDEIAEPLPPDEAELLADDDGLEDPDLEAATVEAEA